MGILAAITAIFRAWPETVAFLNRMADGFEYLQKLSQEKKMQDFLEDLDFSKRKAENAKTIEEKIDAARALSDLIRRL